MAKVQGKKTAVAKRGTSRPAARPKTAAAGKKVAKKPVAPKVRAAKAAAKTKPVAKRAAAPKPAPAKAAKPALKAAPKPVLKPAPKPSPVKAAAPAPKTAPKLAPKPVEKQAAAAAPKPAPKPAPAVAEKRARRSRPRVTSSGGPVANWLQTGGDKPRPSSFMPAPPRAEAPSLVAAPPASSDRLIRNEDLIAPAVRTVPVRVDVEAMGGRVSIYPNPIEVSLRPGEGIEWDFRYLGGADVTVDEIVIEFEKPSPFPQQIFRCKKPGIGRPQRQLSGGATQASAGRRVQYSIRALNMFKTDLGAAKPFVTIG